MSTLRASAERVGGSVLGRLPAPCRLWLARKAPALPVGRPVSNPRWAYDVAHWERFYARSDPWGLAQDPYEREKYELTLELCGDGPFDRALEVGCGEGLFTSLLAPRCRSLLALDISRRAVERARLRCSDFPQVACEALTLPAGYPDGTFDLIVASDVLYYWAPDDLRDATQVIERTLRGGGRLVTAHYALPLNAASNGVMVHDQLSELLNLTHVRSQTSEIGSGRPYRIDVWEQVR